MGFSYSECELCARGCGVDRTRGTVGYCRSTSDIRIARAALHKWEEPIISGTNGSGTIFFSGCSLGCIFCQNREISRGGCGKSVSVERLAEIMKELEATGAHNINFVTPTHYSPSVRDAVILAKKNGLNIPIVYNTSSYDTPETIRNLEGIVDVYLPDFKYYRAKTGKLLSSAENYVDAAKASIQEMLKQCPTPLIENGIIKRGVVARILLLPSHVAEAKLIVKYLFDTYGDSIYISLLGQYTPIGELPASINRRVTHSEYDELVDYAARLGLKNGFTQELSSAEKTYIPDFDNSGV